MATVAETLLRHINEELVDEDARGDVEVDTQLLLDEYVDSVSVIQLVVFIESAFGYAVPPEDITIEHFGTVGLLADYLRGRGINHGAAAGEA
jgi:acyl carrier protein